MKNKIFVGYFILSSLSIPISGSLLYKGLDNIPSSFSMIYDEIDDVSDKNCDAYLVHGYIRAFEHEQGGKICVPAAIRHLTWQYFRFPIAWERVALLKHDAVISKLDVDEENGLLFSMCASGVLKVWKKNDGYHSWKLLHEFEETEQFSQALLFVKEERLLFSTSGHESIKVRKVDTDGNVSIVTNIEKNANNILKLVCSKGIQYLLSGDNYGRIKVWNRRDLDQGFILVQDLQAHKESISGLIFNEGDQQFISSSRDATIKIWGLNDDQQWICLKSIIDDEEESVVSLQFLPKYGHLFYGTSAYNIKIIDMNDAWKLIEKDLMGHENWVSNIAFAESNQVFLSSSYDNSVKIWQKGIGGKWREETDILKGSRPSCWIMSFVLLGYTIFLGCNNGDIHVWRPNESINY